jgi:glycosyltransferase involved in cell wall biosynthesis
MIGDGHTSLFMSTISQTTAIQQLRRVAEPRAATDGSARRPGVPVVLEARVVTESGGGPDKTILSSPRFFAPHGYQVLCAYMRPPSDPGFESLRQRALELDAPLWEVDDRGPWDLGVVREMLRICRSQNVAIWHGHDYKSNLLGLLLRRFWPMRLVTTVHGWVKYTRRSPFYYALDRRSLRYFDRVVCVSDDLHQACLGAGVSASRCQVIENAIDTGQFSRTQSVEEAKARLGFPRDQLLVGAVGRLSAEKGFDRLIEATRRLIGEGVNVQLAIAGQGEEQCHLQELISRSGYADRMHLLGYRADTIDLYQAMDVFALSSLREGLPNVLLEAMALEVPVVATRIAGIPRLIQQGHDGWLVEPDNVADLAAGIRRCADHESFRRCMARNARQTIEARYSFEARTAKFRALFDDLLDRTNRTSSTPRR